MEFGVGAQNVSGTPGWFHQFTMLMSVMSHESSWNQVKIPVGGLLQIPPGFKESCCRVDSDALSATGGQAVPTRSSSPFPRRNLAEAGGGLSNLVAIERDIDTDLKPDSPASVYKRS